VIVTIENTTDPNKTLNRLGLGEDGLATGGQREDPLPYPFNEPANLPDANGTLEFGSSVELPMHPRDFHHSKSQSAMDGDGLEPGEEWNILVNRGDVTFGIGAQADVRDNEELFVAAV
jgi:hypothetical protein